ISDLIPGILEQLELDLPAHGEHRFNIGPIISNAVETGTKGKAERRLEGLHGKLANQGINVIPSDGGGQCCPVLLAFCFDGDKLYDRLDQAVKHAGIHCPNTDLVVFVTSHWKWSDWRKHEREVRRIKARFVVLTGDCPDSFVRVI
ncbi:MAG: hypothetical protein ACKPDI_17240, partial [Actinomycetota bacterium]